MDDETRHQLWRKVAKRFSRVIVFSVVTIACFHINFIFVSLGVVPQPIIPAFDEIMCAGSCVMEIAHC